MSMLNMIEKDLLTFSKTNLNTLYAYYNVNNIHLLASKIWLAKGDNLIIHICGPSGSGKSTLGDKLKEYFGDSIVVKDFDNLRLEFIKKEYDTGKDLSRSEIIKIFDKEKYQLYIDNFISKQQKPLILTGLNHMPWWHKNHYYNTHAQYKFYINLKSDIIFKQKCKRFINDVFCDQQERLVKDLLQNNETHIEGISKA